MIAQAPQDVADPFESERVLLVNGRAIDASFASTVRSRFPGLQVAECDGYFAAIAELCRQPARAVLAAVDPALSNLSDAVAGLREAAGRDARLVLCCRPEAEPIARRASAAGADDYILFPLDEHELDDAIGYARIPVDAPAPPPPPEVHELDALAETVAALSGPPRSLLDAAARMVLVALQAEGISLVVEGTVATAGHRVPRPVLTAPVATETKTLGQILLGPRSAGPYTSSDVARLNRYAALLAHILDAASRHRAWHRLAMTDEITGLPNRRYLHEKMRRILASAARERFPITLLLFDVDDFKTYNDRFGHEAGDEILQIVGRLFRQHCREHDVVVRFGGDEFAVVFWDPEGPRVPGSKNLDSALAVVERFREALRTQKLSRAAESADAVITISGGLAAYPWDGAALPELLAKADEALLAAKKAGKNRTFPVART